MVDQILVTQGNPEHPLPHQARHRVLDQIGRPMIGETAGKALDQPELSIGGAEQHRTGLRGHPAAVEGCHHRPPFNWCKAKQVRATLRLHRNSPWS